MPTDNIDRILNDTSFRFDFGDTTPQQMEALLEDKINGALFEDVEEALFQFRAAMERASDRKALLSLVSLGARLFRGLTTGGAGFGI